MARSEPPPLEQALARAAEGAGAPGDPPNRAHLVDELFRFLSHWSEEYLASAGEGAEVPSAAALAETGLILAREAGGGADRSRTLAVGDWARKAYENRRMRDRVFGDPELFGEPAWDILLDLADAEAAGERLQVTSVCIGSCVPTSTALRWVKVLEDRGLVHREHDPIDARRTFVRLTRHGAERMQRYFAEVSRAGGGGMFFRKRD
ncbi:MAG TPA: MarR family transcriptional regulator [Sphingomonadaceae bacterium]